MPLATCPDCGREVSTAAPACPQCGRPAAGTTAAPACYACVLPATTRCQSCGKMSCAEHLAPATVDVFRNGGGRSELRCAACAEEARSGNVVMGIFWVVFVVVAAAIGALVVR